MLTHLRLLAFLVSLLWQENPAPGDKVPPVDPPKPDDEVKFDDKQQAKVNALLAAERKDAETRTAAKLKDDLAATQAAKAAEEQRKKDEEAGKFDEVRTAIEKERDGFKGERDTLKTENDALTAYFSTEYDAALAELPDVIKAFKPADDASFTTKSAWLTTAQQQAKTIARDVPLGNQPMPRGRENNDIDEKAALAQARRVIRI